MDDGIRSEEPTPSERRHRDWTDEHTRALFLPLLGVLGVLAVVGIAAAWDVSRDVIVAAITAIVTLTASAAGHAAGAARRS